MPRPCRSRHVPIGHPPAAAPHHLARLLELVEMGAPADPDVGFLIVGLTARSESMSAPVTPHGLHGDGAVRDLLCFDAPADWLALAAVVPATTDDVLDSGREVVRAGVAVGRTGSMAWRLQHAGPGRPLTGSVAAGVHGGGRVPTGRLVDVCRRSLGLPTEPPPPTTTELWASLWLDDLFEAAVDGRGPANWAEAAGRHLAMQLLTGAQDLGAVSDADLGVAGAAFGRVVSWARLRTECAAGHWPVPDLTPTEAAWLDDGAFARWFMASFLPVGLVRQELEPLLSESVLCGLDRAIDAWDLPQAEN